jgi:hypothetical protein
VSCGINHKIDVAFITLDGMVWHVVASVKTAVVKNLLFSFNAQCVASRLLSGAKKYFLLNII